MALGERYPLHLGLAYLIFVGYLLRTVFVKFRLPGPVGVIFSGFFFSFFMQDEILEGREELQGLAFFLVLLTAGTEISLADLKPYIIAFGTLPATFELAGIAAYAYFVLAWTKVEAAVLGITLCGLGDGLVIPKMSEFGKQFPGHPLPRLVFIAAPIEASYALTLFGVAGGMADAAGQGTVNLRIVLMANVLRIFATLSAGACIGAAAGWLVSRRESLRLPFTGSTVEAYLIILAAALLGFGVSAEAGDEPLVPMGFFAGSLFQPELMVIVIGCFFAHVVDPVLLHDVEMTMGGVWVFGQLILFSMLGSKSDVSILAQIVSVLPVMSVGFLCRFAGVLLVTVFSLKGRPCTCASCMAENTGFIFHDATFCFLSTLPRATIQGALGPVPMTLRFFRQDPSRSDLRTYISIAARLYIFLMSITGCVLLDAFGPRLLTASQARGARCRAAKAAQEEHARKGWTLQEQRRSCLHSAQLSQLVAEARACGEPPGRPSAGRRRSTEAQRALRVLAARVSTTDAGGLPVVPRAEDRPLLNARASVRLSVVEKPVAARRLTSFTSMHQLEGRTTATPDRPGSTRDEDGEWWYGGDGESSSDGENQFAWLPVDQEPSVGREPTADGQAVCFLSPL